MENKEFELIMTIVNRGFSQAVMDAAREAGAKGGTILHGRGTGSKEAEQFFNIGLGGEKECVFIVVNKAERVKIMDAVMRAERFTSDAQGVIFTLPVEEFVLMRKLHNDAADRETSEVNPPPSEDKKA